MSPARRPAQGSLADNTCQDRRFLSARYKGRRQRSVVKNRNGKSATYSDETNFQTDHSDFDPSAELCPVCEEKYNQEAAIRRPPEIEVSLTDFPISVSKPKNRKTCGHEGLPPVPRAPSLPPSKSGEPSASDDDFEILSGLSCDGTTSEDLCDDDSDAEGWEELERTDAYDPLNRESDQKPELPQVTRKDLKFPPPRKLYADVLREGRR